MIISFRQCKITYTFVCKCIYLNVGCHKLLTGKGDNDPVIIER